MTVRRRIRVDTDGRTAIRYFIDVCFEHADGRVERIRKDSPVQTRRGAEEYERQIREALLDPRPTPKRSVSFQTFALEEWLPTAPDAIGNRRTTTLAKEQHLRVHLLPVLGNKQIAAIDSADVERLYATLRRDRELRPKTIRNIGSTLRLVLATARKRKLIDELPDFPEIKLPDAEFDWLVPSESDRLVAAATDDLERALLLFAIRTGARAGEQLALEWGDLDRDTAQVRLRRSTTRGAVGPTKTGRHRSVSLTRGLLDALAAIEHRRSRLVFCRSDGRPMTLWMLHGCLQRTLRRAGLRRIRWHDLRHTFASQLASAGVPLHQIQAWLGHTTIAMTMRYAHLAPSQGNELIARLDRQAEPLLRPLAKCRPDDGTIE